MSRALFIGRSVLDVVSLVEDFPGPDEKIKALSNDLMSGGSALNAAVVFAHLGGTATLASSLGAPSIVRDLVNADLESRRIHTRDICNDPNYQIPFSSVVSSRSLGTRMIVNGSGNECSLFNDCADLFTHDFDLIQLDQYERPFVEKYYDDIKAFAGPVILDGGSWKDCSPDFLHLADIPIVSEVFCQDGSQAFSDMCTDLGLTRWAITRGANGVLWRDGENNGEIPSVSVSTIDTMGAGDIFHGAFCYTFCETGNFVEALNAANQIAAKSCESSGTRSWMDA